MIFLTGNIIQMAESNSPAKPVKLPFTRSLQQDNSHRKPCIFCGHKLKTRNFKGKAVCLRCLKSIPYIFHYN
ncbi:MAG: hypothetical protein PHV03_07350 [Desulfitobacteriaceae bacterium]|nr:hypothetical protein [Desulfitobacteriaceae bacterium]